MHPSKSSPEFFEHVRCLTRSLQIKHNLKVDGLVLSNEVVRLGFARGNVREPELCAIVSYSDDNLFRVHARTKTFFLQKYATYLGIKTQDYIPYAAKGGNYTHYQDSPYQVLAISIFLANHGELILNGDPRELEAFGKWFHERTVEYNRRMSGDT